MARRNTRLIEFRVEDPSAVLDAIRALDGAHDGWVNFHPQVRPEDEPPPRSGLTTLLLAGPVHDIPVCTWVAGKLTRHGPQPASIGVQHTVGSASSPGWSVPDCPCPTAGPSCRTIPGGAWW